MALNGSTRAAAAAALFSLVGGTTNGVRPPTHGPVACPPARSHDCRSDRGRSDAVALPPDSGGITAIQLPGSGEAVAVGAGAVWVTVIGHPTGVYRVEPATNRIVATIPVDLPTGIAVGTDAVWVTDERHDQVLRIDPQTNRVVARVGVGSGPRRIVVGEGRIWVMNLLGHSISSIDPNSNRVVGEEIAVGRAHSLAVVGGILWVGHGPPPGRVDMIDPRTGQSAGAPLEVDGTPVSIVGGGGSLWVADSYGEVYRFDSATHQRVTRVSVDSVAFELAASRDAIWVAASNGVLGPRSVIRRLDIRTGQLAADSVSPVRRMTFEGLNGMAVGEGALWVASKGELTRFDLAAAPRR